jgi:hypothetical protein
MKFITGLLLLLTVNSFAQIKIINRDLIDSTKNEFFIGVDNHIKLIITDREEYYSIEVNGAGSSITKTGPMEYSVRVTGIDTCKIGVYKKNTLVLTKKYTTHTIPQAVAALQYLRNTSASVSRILLNPYLRIVIPGANYRISGTIISFRTTFVINGDSTTLSCSGNVICPEQKKIIQTLIADDTIWFNDIRGNYADGRTVKFPSFWIKIE